MDIGLKLRELRRLRDLRQKDVARQTGIGEKTISTFETSARTASMKLSQLARLLQVYGVSEEQFFSREIEALFDPNAVIERTREARLIDGLASLPPGVSESLLERFELMLDTARTIGGPGAETFRRVEPQPRRLGSAVAA